MRAAFLVPAIVCLGGCASLSPGFLGDGPGGESAVQVVEVSNFVGRIEINESRWFKLSPKTTHIARTTGDTHRFDGRQDVGRYRCERRGRAVFIDAPREDASEVRIGEASHVFDGDLDSLPVIRIAAPGGRVDLRVRDSLLFGETGDLAALDVSMGVCGDLLIGDVQGKARISLGGDTRVRLDDTSELAGRAAGGSRIAAERVRSLGLDVSQQAEVEIKDVQSGYAAFSQAARGDFQTARTFTATLTDAASLVVEELRGASVIGVDGTSQLRVKFADADRIALTAGGRATAEVDGSFRAASLTAVDDARISLHEVRESLSVDADDRAEIFVRRDPAMRRASQIPFR